MTKKKSQKPLIAVLVLGYNDRDNLKDTLDSVLSQSYGNYKLIYIDNLSTDSSFGFVKKKYPQLKTFLNKKNLGYAGAYKKALRQVFQEEKFDGAVLLNSDVIVDGNWLKELINSAYSNKKIALAQPKIFLYDNKKTDLINTFGNKINYLGFGFCGDYKLRDSYALSLDKEIVCASGCSMLIKKDAYLNIGELDDKFFAYLEDQDLSWRAIMKGYKIVSSAKSIMWHKYCFQSNSRNRWKFYMLERNRLYFIFKNYQLKTIFLLMPAFLFMEAGIIIDAIIKGYFIDKIKGYFIFLKNIGKLSKDRKKIQQERKLSDSQLFGKLDSTINFEEINSLPLRVANIFLAFYYKIIKQTI